MKARSTAIQGALAATALIAAYLTWQRPKETVTTDTVKVLEATKQSLEKIHLDDGTRFIDVVRHTEAPAGLWLTQGYLPGKTPVILDAGFTLVSFDGGVDGGPLLVANKPAPIPPTREVRGNERADNLIERFTPLEASRALGTLSDEKLNELGLAGSLRNLEVTVSGTTHQYVVSKQQPGLIGTYLKDVKTSDVYLMSGTLFNELDPASQTLVDRRLHTFKQAEFDRFTVISGDKRAEFIQTNAEIAQTAKVARVATPEVPEELVKNWHDKIWSRVIVTEVLGRNEVPRAGEPRVELRLEYALRGASKGWTEIALDSTAGTWVRTENTAGWVAVHQGTDELILEGKKLVGR